MLVAGALSAVVATATVQWLYPKQSQRVVEKVAPPPEKAPEVAPAATPAAPSPIAAPAEAATAQAAAAKQVAGDEATALEFIRRAGSGDLPGALQLSAGLTEAAIRDQVTRHQAVPLRPAKLPGGNVLVWMDYRRSGTNARGLYQLSLKGGKVTALRMLTPEGGYAVADLKPVDEQGRPVEMLPYQGKGLLLISPRLPEQGLTELLTYLEATYSPKGVAVVLVMDMRSPDWVAAARQGGFSGPVWRIKSRLEDFTLAGKTTLLGGYGLLVDREGYAVATLGALDPLRYNLPEETPAGVAPTVLRAYGLLP